MGECDPPGLEIAGQLRGGRTACRGRDARLDCAPRPLQTPALGRARHALHQLGRGDEARAARAVPGGLRAPVRVRREDVPRYGTSLAAPRSALPDSPTGTGTVRARNAACLTAAPNGHSVGATGWCQ